MRYLQNFDLRRPLLSGVSRSNRVHTVWKVRGNIMFFSDSQGKSGKVRESLGVGSNFEDGQGRVREFYF